MVALGLKSDYFKDTLVQMASVLWLIYSSSMIMVYLGEVASMLDQPIKCGIPLSGNLTSRQVRVREQCETIDGLFFIPQAQRDEMTKQCWICVIAAASLFFFSSILFIVKSAMSYKKLFSFEDEQDRYTEQRKLDQWRSLYMLGVTTLSAPLVFMVLANILNRLTTFGAWHDVSATAVINSKWGSAVVATQDQESWDTESFLPDFSDILIFEEPGDEDENYIGQYVHNLAVYSVTSFLKNTALAVIALLTDDWHIVSLACAFVPTAVIVTLYSIPYMASFYLHKTVQLRAFLEFDFDGPNHSWSVVGVGIVFGTGLLSQAFGGWMMMSLAFAGHHYCLYLKRLKDNGQEPQFFDFAYWKILARVLAGSSPIPLAIMTISGIIGLPCLGYGASVDGTDSAITTTFNVILGLSFASWVLVFAFAVWKYFDQGDSIYLSDDLP